ncbi:MAG: LpxI family protein [Alphaproteobacteria bacterium]
MRKFGLIAGDRDLPFAVRKWAKKNHIDLYVAGIKGCVDVALFNGMEKSHYINPHLSQLSKVIKFFKSNGVREIVLAGGVNNSSVRITFDVIRLFFKLLFIKKKYDGILRLVIAEFEKNGIKVVGVDEILPDSVITKGVLTVAHPSKKEMQEIKDNLEGAFEVASRDVGQSVIVFDGRIIAEESFKGTDELICRAGKLKNGKGGILIKVLKPHQERRADLPVIGVKTIKNLSDNGFSGIAIEAGNAIFEEKEAVLKLANDKNIFIIGV